MTRPTPPAHRPDAGRSSAVQAGDATRVASSDEARSGQSDDARSVPGDGAPLAAAAPDAVVTPGADAVPADDAVAGGLAGAVERLARVDLDACGDEQLKSLLSAAQEALDRLTSLRAKLTGTLHTRAIRRAGPLRENAAAQTLQEELAGQLRLPRDHVRKDAEVGRTIAQHPASQRAADDGALSGDHAAALASVLGDIDPDVRDEAERRLLAAAATQDVRTFRRTCREVLAELDADTAQLRLDRQRARRRLAVTLDDDGAIQVHGHGPGGVDAELVMTSLDAFRCPDAPGQPRRSAGQRTWDALVAMARAALDAGVAPIRGGIRPHVLVVVRDEVLRGGLQSGTASLNWVGTVPATEIRQLLADAEVSRIIVDAASLPIEASEGVRNVPAAVRKGIYVRDRHCIGDRCDVPAGWCQVMHLATPYTDGGRLTIRTGGLGCSFHHTMLDRRGWVVSDLGGRPVVHHPQRPPPGSTRWDPAEAETSARDPAPAG